MSENAEKAQAAILRKEEENRRPINSTSAAATSLRLRRRLYAKIMSSRPWLARNFEAGRASLRFRPTSCEPSFSR